MITPTPSRGGVAGLAFLFCIAAGGAGLAFDFALNPTHAFWVGAQPGVRALIGIGAALFALLAAAIARLMLSRKLSGGGDAGHS